MSDDDLLTVEESAALAGRAPGTVLAWKSQGRLAVAGYRDSPKKGRRLVLFRRADVLALAAMRPGRPADYEPQPEPTEAELEALIAEQMRPENLPSWWRKGGRE